MKRSILLLITLSLFTILYSENMDDVVDRWLNSELTPSQFLNKLDMMENQLDMVGNGEYLYQQAVFNLYRGAIFFYNDDKERSIKFLDIAISKAETDIELRGFHDSYRVLSEAGSYLMIQKGVSYIIKHSKEVNSNAEKAVALEPENLKARFIIANGLVNAPKLFGGDKKKGTAMLIEILESDNITREIEFKTLFALAQTTKNREYALKAKSIYPNNQRIAKLLTTLKG